MKKVGVFRTLVLGSLLLFNFAFARSEMPLVKTFLISNQKKKVEATVDMGKWVSRPPLHPELEYFDYLIVRILRKKSRSFNAEIKDLENADCSLVAKVENAFQTDLILDFEPFLEDGWNGCTLVINDSGRQSRIRFGASIGD